MEPPKKISFGFTKVSKKPLLVPTSSSIQRTVEAPKEFVKCLEGQEVKLLVEKVDEGPLVVPLKEDERSSSALASLMRRRAVLLGEEEPINNSGTSKHKISATDTLEQKAVKELLAAAEALKNGTQYDATSSDTQLVLPIAKSANDLPLNGARESTIDDYESIPIQEFGKAMLRGMGWDEKETATRALPEVRPKGMGLGADKAIRPQPLLIPADTNETLEIKKNACVRILAGKHKDLYGRIQGMDDYAGRVIVQMAIGGNVETFNEFLCQPVSQKEYSEYGKCLNTAKYKEYKRIENNLKDRKVDTKPDERKKGSSRQEYKNSESRNYDRGKSKLNSSMSSSRSQNEQESESKDRLNLDRLESRNRHCHHNRHSSKDTEKQYKDEKRVRQVGSTEEIERSGSHRRDKKDMTRKWEKSAESDISTASFYPQRTDAKKAATSSSRCSDSSDGKLSDDELSRTSSAMENRRKKKRKEMKRRFRSRTRSDDSNGSNGPRGGSSSKRSAMNRSHNTNTGTSSLDSGTSREYEQYLRRRKERAASGRQHF